MKKAITILCGMMVFASAFAASNISCPRLRLTLQCCQAAKGPAFWISQSGQANDCSGFASSEKLVPSKDCHHFSRIYLESGDSELYHSVCGRVHEQDEPAQEQSQQ